jgi:hypothetical protein
MKTNKWEIWGWSGLCKKFTALAYCRTRKEAVALLANWRSHCGFNRPRWFRGGVHE